MSIRLGCSLALTIGAFIGGCRPNPELDASFYYPIEALHQGLVYEYAAADGSEAPPEYWYLRSLQTPDSTMLISTLYGADFQPQQLRNERIVPSGSLLRDVRLYQAGDSTSSTILSEVLQPALFSFEPPDSTRILVHVLRVRPNQQMTGSATYTLTRNRRYFGDTTFTFEGQNLPAQVWTMRELIEQDSVGVLAIESASLEIYAKGVGLVYRERRFANGEGEAYRLTTRLPMDSLTARLKARLELVE